MAAKKLASEALKYLRKLKKKSVKAKSEAKTPTQNKKAKKLEESYEKESKLANPNLTMDERAEVLGGYKKGGSVKKMKHGGSVKSHRGDGICKTGKTKGRFV